MIQRSYGLIKTSLLDYPEHVAAVIFNHGCNILCPYCHNPKLISGTMPEDFLSAQEITAFLHKRKNVLQGVVLSGGEALLNPELNDLIEVIRSVKLKLKLDTNGTLPDRLEPQKYDYIAMDIKTAPEKYDLLGYRYKDQGQRIIDSARKIIESGVKHEFRITCVPGIVGSEDIDAIADVINGAEAVYLQPFNNKADLADLEWTKKDPYTTEILQLMKKSLEDKGILCNIRV